MTGETNEIHRLQAVVEKYFPETACLAAATSGKTRFSYFHALRIGGEELKGRSVFQNSVAKEDKDFLAEFSRSVVRAKSAYQKLSRRARSEFFTIWEKNEKSKTNVIPILNIFFDFSREAALKLEQIEEVEGVLDQSGREWEKLAVYKACCEFWHEMTGHWPSRYQNFQNPSQFGRFVNDSLDALGLKGSAAALARALRDEDIQFDE